MAAAAPHLIESCRIHYLSKKYPGLACGSREFLDAAEVLWKKWLSATERNILVVPEIEMASFPADLPRFDQLIKLDISNNRFAALPLEVAMLPGLAKLYCSLNLLEEFPCPPGSWPSLKKLDCSRNALTELPRAVGLLPELTVLHCDGNPWDSDWLAEISPRARGRIRFDTSTEAKGYAGLVGVTEDVSESAASESAASESAASESAASESAASESADADVAILDAAETGVIEGRAPLSLKFWFNDDARLAIPHFYIPDFTLEDLRAWSRAARIKPASRCT